MTPFPYSMLVNVDDSDHEALEQHSRFYYPAYMGPSMAGTEFHGRRGGLRRGT